MEALLFTCVLVVLVLVMWDDGPHHPLPRQLAVRE